MEPEKRRRTSSEDTRASASNKRKHSSIAERSQRHKKKRRKTRKSESEMVKPDPTRSPTLSNRFFEFGSSSSRTRRKERSRRREPSSNRSSSESSRNWVSSSHDFSTYRDKIVFVSYNILGVENASKHPDLYCKVPRRFLEWDRRKTLIHEEINRYDASILCLQEVDRFDDLDNLFQKDGFKGVYKVRTGEADDGCAIFWKEELFTLLHQENIEFQNFGLRNNVAQLCVLKMNQDLSELDVDSQTSLTPTTKSRSLVIGNIHVLFNPNRGDVKLGQVRLFLEKAYKLSREWGCIPVIIGGDLNSIPQSPMYQFMASSKLDVRHYDRRRISEQVQHPSQCGSFRSQNEKASSFWTSISRPMLYRWSEEELQLATGSEGVTYLQHHLKLCSAYLGVPGSCRTRDDHGEPLATSYHSKFKGTVDYIWHTEELVPVRVLETLPVNILKRIGGLPNEKWGSDHLALVCELAFIDDCDRT
ncbi:hypothetical protein FEM48_Zijuj05G0105900 [Ziziphus jujuba var. spinosa]|uniref:Endonuclease/exonuclease/phosphatase domain-containing protein n=1 Tax=Ziziphus jujuba var. spinosa TaxID=714518 RepID=A0A978VEG6_ZIZJJ|nr:hypothetical protein FEM48_Zijuj05G0105900 [Ziziphus jujuba var. spinosa]